MSEYSYPSEKHFHDDEFHPKTVNYTVSSPKEPKRKRNSYNFFPDSSGSSQISSLKSNDHQGWNLQSLYHRLTKNFHKAWKEVRFKGKNS